MDLESGLQLADRRNQPLASRRTLERSDSAADRSRDLTNPTRTFTPDTVRPIGAPPQAPRQPQSGWAKFGKALSYVVVGAAAIGGEHAGIAIQNSLRTVTKPVFTGADNVPRYVPYDNLQVHHNLTSAFDEALTHMYKSRQMNETIAYLRKAPPNFLSEGLTIDPPLGNNGNSYDALSNGISWDPTIKYVVELEDSGNKVISSATALMKQLHNAKDALSNAPAYFTRAGLGHPNYSNLQEKSAIEQTNDAHRQIGDGEIQHVDVENFGILAATNSTLDTALPSYDTVYPSLSNSTILAETVRSTLAGNNAATRTDALEQLRQMQSAFFHNAGPETQVYFRKSFNVSNLQKIESLMRDGEAIVLESGNAVNNASSAAAFEVRLKNYTDVAETFAATLLDRSKDAYSAHTLNKTNYHEIPAAEPFQMGAQANASLSHLEAQAPGTLEAQLAALSNATAP